MTSSTSDRAAPLLRITSQGVHCKRGAFYIDPWRPVRTAILTHAHSDHAYPGSQNYFCAKEGVHLARRRLGPDAHISGLDWGEKIQLGDVTLSFHPAGHILGSAQVRVEDGGEVWVFSGDYKRQSDPTTPPFEVIPCDTFVSEATFALPIYRWPTPESECEAIFEWWMNNRNHHRASVLYCYALGKAQRILAELKELSSDPIYVHGAVESFNALYRDQGICLPETSVVTESEKKNFAGELILSPGSAEGSAWLRRFGDFECAFASGWMRVRGTRRRRNFDRGFVISDHADWPSLLKTIQETGAKRILFTHGYTDAIVRHCHELGLNAQSLKTPYEGERL